MGDKFNYCHIVAKTDIGRKRAANEDNMYNAVTQNGLVSVVCDGMGGHVGGATASSIAISAIFENLNSVYYKDPRVAIGESIDKANNAIIQRATEQPELSGMGSTCVMLIVRDGKVYIGHVGDSRIYLVRSRKIIQLTKDHSYVQMLVDCGEITKEEAERHPRRNEITNALGIPGMSPATVLAEAINPEAGDCFVLCSDGLSGMVSDNTICKVVSNQLGMGAQERADKLVDLANENGGVDNITVQLVEFSVTPGAKSRGGLSIKSISVKPKFIAVATAILAAGVGATFIVPHLINKSDTPIVVPVDGKNDTDADTDTRFAEPIQLGTVEFQQRATIVKVTFNEDFVIIKGDKGIFRRVEDRFDMDTFWDDNKNISLFNRVDNEVSLIFGDTYPGESVSFTLTNADRTVVHEFIINVTQSSGNRHGSGSRGRVVASGDDSTASSGANAGSGATDKKAGDDIAKNNGANAGGYDETGGVEQGNPKDNNGDLTNDNNREDSYDKGKDRDKDETDGGETDGGSAGDQVPVQGPTSKGDDKEKLMRKANKETPEDGQPQDSVAIAGTIAV